MAMLSDLWTGTQWLATNSPTQGLPQTVLGYNPKFGLLHLHNVILVCYLDASTYPWLTFWSFIETPCKANLPMIDPPPHFRSLAKMWPSSSFLTNEMGHCKRPSFMHLSIFYQTRHSTVSGCFCLAQNGSSLNTTLCTFASNSAFYGGAIFARVRTSYKWSEKYSVPKYQHIFVLQVVSHNNSYKIEWIMIDLRA